MRVLMFNRDPNLWLGGDSIQVQQTAESLRKMGVEVDIGHQPDVNLSSYDLIHIYHLTFPWGMDMGERCLKEGVPYLYSAIHFPSKDARIKVLAAGAKALIALSEPEMEEIVRDTGCDRTKVSIIPNGVDKKIYSQTQKRLGLGVVSIGPIHQPKGIDLLAAAVEVLGLRWYQIGKFHGDSYGAQCISKMTKHFDSITPKQVASILRCARVYVCPSLSDRQSLGVLEAASCGLNIVDSKFNRGSGLLPNSIVVDPYDLDTLCEAISIQYAKTEFNPDRHLVQSWDDIGMKVKSVYDSINLTDVPQKLVTLTDNSTLPFNQGEEYEIVSSARGSLCSTPRVSIIVPCYNTEKYLPETLDSISRSKYTNYEVVIVDDGSTSPVRDSLGDWTAKLPIKLIRQCNKGLSAARNTGIRHSCGEYILPLDSDDKIDPTYISKAVKVLDADLSIDIVGVDTAIMSAEGGKSTKGYQTTDCIDAPHHLQRNNMNYCSMYRRQVWEDVGGYDESLPAMEDWDFWLSCAKKKHRLHHIKEPLFIYRVRQDGLLNTSMANEAEIMRILNVKHGWPKI